MATVLNELLGIARQVIRLRLPERSTRHQQYPQSLLV
jgi:hypothetical protein